MVAPSALSHVRTAESAKQAWRSLAHAYEDEGLTRRLGLMRALFGLKLDSFSSMEEYVASVASLNQQLADLKGAA